MSYEQMNIEREASWAALSDAAPELGVQPSLGWEKEIPLRLEGRVRMVMSLSQDRTSVYLVGRAPEAKAWIKRHETALALGLRAVAGKATSEAEQGRWFRKNNTKACVTQRSQWPEMIRWLRAQHLTFSGAVNSVKDA